jgi:hypothetical protein
MSAAFMGGLAVVVFLYLYLKRELALPLEAQSDFQVSNVPYCISRALLNEKGETLELYRTTYFLQVGKASQTGEVLRQVQARIFGFGEPVLTEIKGEGTGTKDVRHGEWIFVRLGSVVSKTPYGLMQGNERASSEEATTYSHNVSAGFFSFEVSDFGGRRAFGLASVRENKEWKILIVISADDVLSFQAHVLVDMANLENLIKAIEPLRS